MKRRVVWFSMVRITDESNREWLKIERRLYRQKMWTEDWRLLSSYGFLAEDLIMPTTKPLNLIALATNPPPNADVGVWAGTEVEYVA